MQARVAAIRAKLVRNFRKSHGYDSLGECNDNLLEKLKAQQGLDDTCYKVAEEHLVENLVGAGSRNLCSTTAGDFGEWGVGVQLYFQFTSMFATFSLLIGAMYTLVWIFCIKGDALRHLDSSANGLLQVLASKMTIANIGLRNFQSSNWIRSDTTTAVFGHLWNLKDVSLMVGIVDAVCAGLILMFLWYFEFVHIPKVVSAHWEESPTPDIYTVFVDFLPRRLYGSGGQDSYSDRLKQHFELILAAVVHPDNAYKGMLVVDAKDEGLPHERRPYTSFCWCCVRRAPGFDLQGRRIGSIVKVSGKTCLVKWHDKPGNPVEWRDTPGGNQQKYEYVNEDLIDAKLLWKMEINGIDRVPLPKKSKGFAIGDRVWVMKESRLKGEMATVIDPQWKGNVQVLMDKEDHKGKVKSFKHGELMSTDEAKNILPSDSVVEEKNPPLSCPATKDDAKSDSSSAKHDAATSIYRVGLVPLMKRKAKDKVEDDRAKHGSVKESCDSAIHSVGLVRDFHRQLAKMRNKAMKDDRSFESKIRKQQNEGETMQAMKAFKAKYEDDDFENGVQLEDRDVVGAFITFEHTKHRDFIYSEFRFSRTISRSLITTPYCTFNDSHLRVTEAQAPSDVYWDNLDFPLGMRLRRRLIVLGSSALLIICLALAIGFARNAAEEANASAYSNASCGSAEEHPDCACIAVGFENVLLDEPAGIYDQCKNWASKVGESKGWSVVSSIAACVVIITGGFIVVPMVFFERSKSVTSVNRKIMSITSQVYILALGIVRLFSNAKWPVSILGLFGDGRFEDLTPDWFLAVGTSIVFTLTLNTFYPIVGLFQGPFFQLWVRCRKRKQELLTDLIALYTPPLFPFALRHAEQMSSLFALVLFCGGMPFLGMLVPLNFWLFYAIDKYSFLRASRIPPRYTHHLIKRQVQFLQFGILCHSCFSVWVFSNDETLPSHCIQCSEDDAFLSIKPSAGTIQKLLSRCFVSSALPNTILGSIVAFSLLARLVVFLLGRNPLAQTFIRTGMDRMKLDRSIRNLNFDDAFRSEARSMKRQGLACTYNIQEMPGYEFLKPAQDSKPATKIMEVALGLHGLADGMKDHMKDAADNLKADEFTLIKSGRSWSKAKNARRLIRAARSSPIVQNFQDAIGMRRQSSAPIVTSRPKAKGKGRGKGKLKNFATQIHDPEYELHLEDLAQARHNLGIGVTRDESTTTPVVLPSRKNNEIDELLGLKIYNLSANASPRGKGKGKGKSKLHRGPSSPIASQRLGPSSPIASPRLRLGLSSPIASPRLLLPTSGAAVIEHHDNFGVTFSEQTRSNTYLQRPAKEPLPSSIIVEIV